MVRVICDLCGKNARTPYLEVHFGPAWLRYHRSYDEEGGWMARHQDGSGIICRDCLKRFLADEEISRKGDAE